jgi:dihydroflavonol-4-reductase
MSLVLVTGGSGYVGSHTLVAAVDAGHDVRTTIRDLGRADQVRALVEAGGADPSAIEFAAADLTSDTGWADAVAGVDGVLHVASPIPLAQPGDPDDLVVPARDGTLRVLRAARDGGVGRVVVTSSFATIGYGRSVGRAWNEDDWTEPSDALAPYPLSKVIAERAAWDFAADGSGPELVVLNPTGVFGPVLGPDVGSSVGIILGLMTGRIAEAPRQSFGVADVRDVAVAHLRALEADAAVGQRFLLTSPPATSWLGVAEMLRRNFGDRAAKCPTQEVAGDPVPTNEFDVSRAVNLLGWQPRPAENTIVEMTQSLERVGLLG